MSIKREAKGYVAISRKKKCNNGKGTKFEIALQDGEKSCVSLQGFSEESYFQLSQFAASKSPVKISLFKNPGYRKEVINERSTIETATFHDVPFAYSPKLCCVSESSLPPTVEIDLVSLLSLEGTDGIHYSVIGKLFVGTEKPKIAVGKKLKEDVMLFDGNEKIKITVWEPLIERLVSNQMVKITYLKLKHFKEEPHMTTSPFSVIEEIEDNDEVMIPCDYSFDDHVTITVESVYSVGKHLKFSCCAVCEQRVQENDIRKKSFHCGRCGQSYRMEKLSSTYMLHLFVTQNSERLELVVSKQIILPLLPSDMIDADLIDEVLDLSDLTITFSKKNNTVFSITT